MVVCCNMLWRDATCCTEVCVQVHTPNEVFQAMVDLGQSVVYRRIPVVDSFSWSDSDFDDLLSALKVGRCLRVECPGIHIPTRTPRPNTSQPRRSFPNAQHGLVRPSRQRWRGIGLDAFGIGCVAMHRQTLSPHDVRVIQTQRGEDKASVAAVRPARPLRSPSKPLKGTGNWHCGYWQSA